MRPPWERPKQGGVTNEEEVEETTLKEKIEKEINNYGGRLESGPGERIDKMRGGL